MFFNQDSTCVLKAQLTAAVATSQLEISVNYKDNTDNYHKDAIVATNNTTAVTLLAAPSSGVVNLVESIKIYNPDTQANTVQILVDTTVIFTATVGAGQSAIISDEGISNGLGYTPADSDLSNLTTAGKAKISNLAMPSSSYIDLTLGASGSTYTAPTDGKLYINKSATATDQYIAMDNGIYTRILRSVGSINSVRLDFDLKKGDVVTYTYTVAGTTNTFRFIYAEGSKP